jgi:hypothetical protein
VPENVFIVTFIIISKLAASLFGRTNPKSPVPMNLLYCSTARSRFAMQKIIATTYTEKHDLFKNGCYATIADLCGGYENVAANHYAQIV